MRAFVALDLSEAWLRPIARLQAGLAVGRAMPEENLHLTLAFLDDVSDGAAHAVAETLDGTRLPPVALALSGLDLFGGRRPNVLVLRAEGTGLGALQAKVVRAVRTAGVDLPRTRFRPHVTIARFARDMSAKDQARLGEFLDLNGTFALPPEPALSVTLYRSHLTRDGAYHEPLASFPLAR